MKRIQRKRTAGWRMPAGAIYVGRPTKWGNPFAAPEPTASGRAIAVEQFRSWLEGQPDLRQAIRQELAGHDLACWCPLDHPCHGDILLAVANPQPD